MKKFSLAAILVVTISGLFLAPPAASASAPDHLELNQTNTIRLTPDDPTAVLSVDLPEAGHLSMTVNAFFPYAEYTVLSGNERVLQPSILFYGSPDAPETEKNALYLEKGRYTIVLNARKDWSPEIAHRDFSVALDFKPAANEEKEPNQTLETAERLPLTSHAIRGLLTWSDRVDTYKLVVPKAGKLSLDYLTNAEDSRVTLLDENGKELYEKRCEQLPGGTFRSYDVTTHLEAGTYYARVTSQGLSEYFGGLYTIQAAFSPIQTNDQEPNNDPASSQTLPVGEWMPGLLSFKDTVDYYSLTITKPMHIRLNFEFFATDFGVQVKNSAGIWYYDTNYSMQNESVPSKFSKELKLEPGTYVIRLTGGNSVSTTGTYRLFAEDLALTKQFADVSPTYKEGVDYLVRNNITKGMTSTTFGVTQKLKRADAAVLLAKSLGIQTDGTTSVPFKDVPARAAVAVQALQERGIMNGKSPEHFGANDSLTRGEVALVLSRAYNLSGYGVTNQFKDVSAKYELSVNGMVRYKVAKGKTPDTFGTADPISRGEIAIFLYRASLVKR